MPPFVGDSTASPVKTFPIPPLYVPPATLTNFSTIASYSWMKENDKPILSVPGRPPQWTRPRLPYRVPKDQGIRYIDHTGAQCKRLEVSRLMPLVQSIELCSPGFDYKSLDLICNRNNLRNLVNWLEANNVRGKDFRIDVQLVNQKTLVMLEKEASCTEFVSSREFRGYGDSFRAKTVKGPAGQQRHNRVVSYRLGNLHVLMGHKVEGFTTEARANRCEDLDSLISSFNSVDINKDPALQAGSDSPITVPSYSQNGETEGPQPQADRPRATPRISVRHTSDHFMDYNFVEIKTLGYRKGIDWRLYHPQLYLSRTNHLVTARHHNGQFIAIEDHKLDSAELKMEMIRTEQSLGRLVHFLGSLVDTLAALEEGMWSLVCVNKALSLYRSTEVLPQDVLVLFE